MFRFRACLLLLISLLLFNDLMFAPEAEARRRRGLFGRRARPVMARRNVNRARARNVAVRRNGNIDRDLFSRFPLDLSSSLVVDPTGSLAFFGGRNLAIDPRFSQLGLQPRFVRGRNGDIFELSGGAVLENAQPVLINRGQIIGGLNQRLSPESEAQARIINQTGDLSLIPSVDQLADPSLGR